MKIIKTLAVAGVATMLLAGNAFAWNGNNENCDVEKTDLKMQLREKVASFDFSKISSRPAAMNVSEIIEKVTGKSAEEVKELCASLREEGKSLIDYLKEENLLDNVKETLIENAEEKLNVLLEDGRITEEELSEKLEAITLRINDEEFKLFGGVYGNKTHKGFVNNDILELTGLDAEAFRELCVELKQEGKTVVDYLKDQGLYDEWKTKQLDSFNTRLESAIESNRLSEEKAAELKEQFEQKIEDGKVLNLMGKVKSMRVSKNSKALFAPNEKMLELTGLTADEFKDLCSDLKEEGKTVIDYLKDNGLFDEFKQDMLDSYTERINSAVENGKLTQEKAQEMLAQYEDKLENGFNFGSRGMATIKGSLAKSRFNKTK